MVDFNYGLSQRELIRDPAVVEELDRLVARLRGFLQGFGQRDIEADLDKGINSPGGVRLTRFMDLSGPFILPVKTVTLQADTIAFDPGDFSSLRVLPTGAARTIRGIVAGIDGQRITIYVPASATLTLTLSNDDATADADKRIDLVGDANISTVAGQARAFDLFYDGVDRRWVQFGGSASIAAAAPKSAFVSGTQGATDASTNEIDLVTTNLAANSLAANGDALVIHAFGNFANNANGKRLRYYWNGVAIIDTGAQGWQDQGWQLHVLIIRTGAATQQVHAQFIPAIAGVSASPGDYGAATATLSGAVATKISGQNSVASASDITFEGWSGFILKAP